MPSFAFGRSNKAVLVEGERTKNSPWAFQAELLMAKKKDVQSYILEGSITEVYYWTSFFMTIMISLFPIGEHEGHHSRWNLFAFYVLGSDEAKPSLENALRCPKAKPIRIFFLFATFSLLIRLPSTGIRLIRHANPQLFESAPQSGNFWIRYESKIVWMLNLDFFFRWRNKILSPLPWIFKMVPCVMLSLFCFLDFSFKSYNVCAVKPSYDCCTLQLCQTTAQHSKASFFGAAVGPTNWTP